MRIRTWLFLAFLIVPAIEIVLFYLVGTAIGIWPTIAIVIATAFLGSSLVARQGRRTWVNIRTEIAAGRPPTVQLVHGAMILVAGALPRHQYLALMKGSEALVFPSLDEGFGIPVAEAQALRVPVISSRAGSLREVAIGSVEIDPTDHRDIAAKITDLVSDDERKEAVAEEGWRNSRHYSKEWGPNGLISAIRRVCAT